MKEKIIWFDDLFIKLREYETDQQKREVFTKCFFQNRTINLGTKIIDDPYNCNRCAYMDWSNSLKQEKIVCGGAGLKVKKNKCVNQAFGCIESIDNFGVLYAATIIFVLIPAIILYLKALL